MGEDYRKGAYLVNGKNQYQNVAGTALDYDLNGNLTKDGSIHYGYDNENRLISVNSGTITATLTYDPLGRLFETLINGQRRQFLYDGDALVAEYSSSSSTTPVARYLHGNGAAVPLVQYNGSAVGTSYRRFLHVNHQGSIIAQSDYNGNVLVTNTYDAFGIPEVGNQGRFGYTGQVWLPELGLYHYKARMYEPRVGRFLQTDPVGYDDQMNLYAYVGNDPVNMVDPTGMEGACAGSSADTCTEYGFGIDRTNDVISNIAGYKNAADADKNMGKDIANMGSDIKDGAVDALRSVETASSTLATAAAAGAIAAGLNPLTAEATPLLATASGVATLVSAVTGTTADVINGSALDSTGGVGQFAVAKSAEMVAHKFGASHIQASQVEAGTKLAVKYGGSVYSSALHRIDQKVGQLKSRSFRR